jgi:hypothetical protein
LKKYLLVLAGIIALIVIAAAALLMMARPLPSALVLDRTCQAPCWLGITPGVSTSWGVTEPLLQADFVDAPTIERHEWGPLEGLITWRFKRPAGDLAGFAYFDGETLSYLRILTLGAMSLGEALEQRDRPTEAWTQVNMIYPGLGCTLEVRFDSTGQLIPASVVLTRDTPIRAVVYFNPSDPPAELSVTEEQIQQWAGLGAVSLPSSAQ